MWNKFESFMDAYVAFVECGVRGWLLFSAITFISFGLFLLGLISQDTAALIMMFGIGPLIALWSRDHALGYVPVWWLKLGNKAYK